MNNSRKNSTYFFWSGLEIEQGDAVHKIGTDAILLSSWIPKIINSAKSILDVGTGTGVIALAMAQAFPDAEVTAMDIHPEAVRLTRDNCQRSNFVDRITVIEKDFLDAFQDDIKFDLLVSNPPYYTTTQPSPTVHKRIAKHNDDSIEEWMIAFRQAISERGNCCIIVPGMKADEWIRAANDQQLYNVNRLDIFSFALDANPVRSLLHLSPTLKKPKFSRLIIYDQVNTYTGQYLEVSGIAKEGSE